MAASNVVNPNSRVRITDQGRVQYLPATGQPDVVANIQKDNRPSLPDILAARGRGAGDITVAFRVRVDLLPKGRIPQPGDRVFVAKCQANPALRGWYTIWDHEPTSGPAPTLVVYVIQENRGARS